MTDWAPLFILLHIMKYLLSPWRHPKREKRVNALRKMKDEKLLSILLEKEEVTYAEDIISAFRDDENLSTLARRTPSLDLCQMALDNIEDRLVLFLLFRDPSIKGDRKKQVITTYIRKYALGENSLKGFFRQGWQSEYSKDRHGDEWALFMASLLEREEDIAIFLKSLSPLTIPKHRKAFIRAVKKIKDVDLVITLSANLLQKRDEKDLAHYILDLLEVQQPHEIFKNLNRYPLYLQKLINQKEKPDHLLKKIENDEIEEDLIPSLIQELQVQKKLKMEDLVALARKYGDNHYVSGDNVLECLYPLIGSKTIQKQGLVDSFGAFICRRADQSNSILARFRDLIDALPLEFRQERYFEKKRCEYCDGSGREAQHSDRGRGEVSCPQCGGSGERTMTQHRYVADRT